MIKIEHVFNGKLNSPSISHSCDLIERIAALEHLRAGYGLHHAATKAAPDQAAILAFVQCRLGVCYNIAQLGAAFNLKENI